MPADALHASMMTSQAQIAPPHVAVVNASVLKERAACIIQKRQERAHFLPKIIFGEPAWDIMLKLFIADEREVEIDASERNSVEWRWTTYLASVGLIAKKLISNAPNSALISLTAEGEASLIAYLSSVPLT